MTTTETTRTVAGIKWEYCDGDDSWWGEVDGDTLCVTRCNSYRWCAYRKYGPGVVRSDDNRIGDTYRSMRRAAEALAKGRL